MQSNLTTYAAAGNQLHYALATETSGYICTVEINAAQLEIAASLATHRRTRAKLAMQQGARDYAAAAHIPNTPTDQAAMASDRRGLLSELLVGDVLGSAGVQHSMQALVSHRAEPGADLTLGSSCYDVKSASGLSADWSPAGHQGRTSGDRYFICNEAAHHGYTAMPSFAGYVCVYFEIENGAPVRGSLYYVTADAMQQQHIVSKKSNAYKNNDYYRHPI